MKRRQGLRRTRGLTLLELMIALSVTVMVALGAAKAFEAGVSLQTKVLPQRRQAEAHRLFERRLAELVSSAYLSPGGGGASTYFVGFTNSNTGGGIGLTATNPADTLTFTSGGLRPAGAYMESEDDFETLNSTFGPQGGLAEVSLSMVAVGDPGNRTGPYLRVQRPADGDFTQGGFESVLDPDVTSISFEFYDGTAWVGEWDSSTMPEPRLPAAVRVTYQRRDESSPRVLIVRIPLSDVTPDNPAGVGLGGNP